MLIAIDTNEEFVDYLNADIADSRFLAVHGSAADVRRIIADHGFDHADYILSGLPFSTLPNGVGPAIARETQAALRPGGASSEERRVGQACVSTCRSRWSPDP